MITRLYQPLLDKLELTYPQFLVMLVLWEHKKLTVGQIGEKLYLNTNTTTPLIKKLMDKKYILKNRSLEDERILYISLTQAGKELQKSASTIPECLIKSSGIDPTELIGLKKAIDHLLAQLITVN